VDFIRCEICWPLEDAIKAQEGKSYQRGPVDFKERTKPPYPSTPEQLAIRVAPDNREEKPQKAVEPVAPGVEVPVESLIKRTKKGAINTQSTLGKVVAAALDAGCELKAGRSERLEWVQGAHHGLRFTVTGATVVMNGHQLFKREIDGRVWSPVKQLLIRLAEIKEG
jgi:hypothetical protein